VGKPSFLERRSEGAGTRCLSYIAGRIISQGQKKFRESLFSFEGKIGPTFSPGPRGKSSLFHRQLVIRGPAFRGSFLKKSFVQKRPGNGYIWRLLVPEARGYSRGSRNGSHALLVPKSSSVLDNFQHGGLSLDRHFPGKGP